MEGRGLLSPLSIYDIDKDKIIEIENGDKTEIITIDPRFVSIDESCIDSDLCSMGRFLLYYGELETVLRLEVERKQAALKRLEADLDAMVRANAKNNGEKLTEAMVTSEVIKNVDRQALIASMLKSQKNHNLARWVMTALNAKKECLIAISYRENQIIKADRYANN